MIEDFWARATSLLVFYPDALLYWCDVEIVTEVLLEDGWIA